MHLNTVTLQADKKTGEVMVYDRIGDSFWAEGVGAKPFAQQIKALGPVDTIRVRINSPGGDVFQGNTIYNTLKDHPARIEVHVDGLAASAASIIAMAGDEIYIAENAAMMIHKPTGAVGGTVEEILSYAGMMQRVELQAIEVYVARTGLPTEEVAEMVKAETWMTGKEAVEKKFATHLSKNKAVAASCDVAELKNVPEWARPLLQAAQKPTEQPNMDGKEKTPATPETPAAKTETQVDAAAISKTATEAERARMLAITAVCKTAGKLDMADKFIEAGKSIHEVREELLNAVCSERKPVLGDNDETVVSGEGADEDAPFKKEFAQNAAAYKAEGFTEESFVKMRRVDTGKDKLVAAAK